MQNLEPLFHTENMNQTSVSVLSKLEAPNLSDCKLQSSLTHKVLTVPAHVNHQAAGHARVREGVKALARARHIGRCHIHLAAPGTRRSAKLRIESHLVIPHSYQIRNALSVALGLVHAVVGKNVITNYITAHNRC